MMILASAGGNRVPVISQLVPADEDFVIQTATTRPRKLGQSFTRWSIRKLAACLRKVHGRLIRIGREVPRIEFGPLGIRPTAGSCWAERGRPDRLPATYHRTHGVTYLCAASFRPRRSLSKASRLQAVSTPARVSALRTARH
jgi:hypothetical protein